MFICLKLRINMLFGDLKRHFFPKRKSPSRIILYKQSTRHLHESLVVDVLQLSPYVAMDYVEFRSPVKELRSRSHIVIWLCGLTLSVDAHVLHMTSKEVHMEIYKNTY